MKTKNIQIKLIGIVVLLISFGCNNEDFFELERPPQFAWLKAEDLEFGIVSVYNKAFLDDWSNPVGNNFLIFTCLSDHVQLLPNTSADISYNEFYDRVTGPGFRTPETTPSFTDNYNSIGSCNALLDFYKQSNGKPFPDATSDARRGMNRILGEAYFMRAFNYWHLALRHLPKPGDPDFNELNVLPKRVTLPQNKEDAIYINYMSGAQTFELIMADLDSAKKYLPLSYRAGIDDDSYEFGRANRYAAYALSMRVQFYLGAESSYPDAWDKALADANFIIESGQYSLDESPLTAWQNDQIANLGNEVIWYALFGDPVKGNVFKRPTSFNYSHYLAVDGNRGAVHNRTPWNQFTWAHSTLQELGWFDENLNTTDEALADQRYQELYYRLEGNRGENDNPTIYEMQYPSIKEPQLWCDKYYRAPVGQHTNIPLFRLNEIYLTRSILSFKKGNSAQALQDLNKIRNRSELSSLNELTEEDIHHERLKELAFEMDWVIYKISLQLPLTEGDRNPTVNRNVRIEYPYKNFYYEINQTELDFKQLNEGN